MPFAGDYGFSRGDVARAKERRRLAAMTFHERKAERVARRVESGASRGGAE